MGSGASSSKDAPHLAEYFKKLKAKTEATQEQMMDVGLAMLASGSADQAKKAKEEMLKWYEEEGKPCLTKSFEHHDKDKSGVLENAEAKVFFLNLIQETETFTLALAQSMAQKGLTLSIEMMKAMMGAADAKKMEKEAKAEIKKVLDAQKKDYDKRIKDYKDNKEARDADAFKVMDTSADGKIQLSEFLETFNPESDKQPVLLVALGFMTEQERVQQEQMKMMAAEGGAGGCEQQ
eukprot:TRINITY_DN8323_c0_g1_i6.p1 TRINITY_DN8323_c0_g1~~TRINITY_DN8323_c0_g1_i6.p1  ORF type:complete len:263 (+),score=88.49 TRINITY_DN8323_c0_g1_i6:86-790(+)